MSMEIKVKLPKAAARHNSIMVFVDRLSKKVHLVPTTEALDAHVFAVLFVNNLVQLLGLRATLIANRGSQFHDKFWESTCELLSKDKRMSSAFHPQTDGQTERTNCRRCLEPMWATSMTIGMKNLCVLSLPSITPGKRQ